MTGHYSVATDNSYSICDSCEHKEFETCPTLPADDTDDGDEYKSIACSDYKRFK